MLSKKKSTLGLIAVNFLKNPKVKIVILLNIPKAITKTPTQNLQNQGLKIRI